MEKPQNTDNEIWNQWSNMEKASAQSTGKLRMSMYQGKRVNMRREKWDSIRPKECHIHQGIISMRTEKVTTSNLLPGLGRFWSATNLNFSQIWHQTAHCVAWPRWTVFLDKYSSDSHRCRGLSVTSVRYSHDFISIKKYTYRFLDDHKKSMTPENNGRQTAVDSVISDG